MSHRMPGDELGPCPCGHRQAMCHRVNAAKWCPPDEQLMTALDALEAANKERDETEREREAWEKHGQEETFARERAEAERDRIAEAARAVERLFYLRDEEYTEEEGGAAFSALRSALAGGGHEEPEHQEQDLGGDRGRSPVVKGKEA